MNKPAILSTHTAAIDAAAGMARPLHARAFDACHVGVVLRVVLFVQTVLAVGVMFETATFLDWTSRFALITGGALPATLAWLLLACALKSRLDRARLAAHYGVGATLGALAGLAACALLAAGPMADALVPLPWLGSAVAGALLALLVVAGLVLRARSRTPAAVTAQLAELQARIRPHFLFNTLNSAIALVRAEPARAEALLEDLSDLFRHALLDQGESTTLEQEIALARHYLAIEQVRFGDRLQVVWAIDPAAGAARLPPLLLQPLVENAVIHGVEPSAEPREVRISTARHGGVVTIEIVNQLPAMPRGTATGTHGHGMALANVQARLNLLHDLNAEFEAAVQEPGGSWRVRIRLPA